MPKLHARYVVDERGKRTAVLLSVAEYRRLLEGLEELDAVRAYDAAKASGGKPISLEEAVARIEKRRR